MRLLVFTNLFVALCAAGLTLATYLSMRSPPDLHVVAFVFFSTLAVYNFDRLVGSSTEDAVAPTPRLAWVARNRKALIGLTIGAILGIIVSGLGVPVDAWVALVPLALATALYSIPVIPWRGRRLRLKDVAILKTLLIAFVWAMATAALPMGTELDVGFVLERMLFVFAITLPFEIRDVERDGTQGISTIPILLGVTQTKWLAALCLLAFAVSSWFHFDPAIGAALALSGALTIPLVLFTHVERGDYFYSVLMDGTMLLQLGLLVVLA